MARQMSHERKETGSAFCEREFTLLSSEANRESWPCGNEANVFLNSKIPLHRETILEFQYPWIVRPYSSVISVIY